jgi:hypothetical protein
MAMHDLASIETSAAGMVRNYGSSAEKEARAMAKRLRDRDDKEGEVLWDGVVTAIQRSADFATAQT